MLLWSRKRNNCERQGDNMKIGQHQGFRADNEGSLGYVFPTITSNNNHILFIYDKPNTGHSASIYFERHPENWKDEYNTRCYWTSERFVKIFKVIL